MLKKFIIFCLVTGGIVYFAYNFINSGRCEKFIVSRWQSSWAPGALYYLGDAFLIIQKPLRAEKVYERVMEIFPETKYYEPSFYKYYYIASSHRRRKEAIQRGRAYIKEFSSSHRVDRIRQRIHVLENY